MFRYTFFQGLNDTSVADFKDLTWEQLAQELAKSYPISFDEKGVADKSKDYKCFSLATYEGSRNKASAKSVQAVILDVDTDLSYDKAKEKLDSKGVNYIMFTTVSNNRPKKKGNLLTSPCERFRVIIPLDEPITDDARYKGVYHKISSEFFANRADTEAIGMWRANGCRTDDPNGTKFDYKIDCKNFEQSSLVFASAEVRAQITGVDKHTVDRKAICSMLDAVSPDLSRSDWMQIAWAIHGNFYENQEDIDFGAVAFTVWSSQGDKFKGEIDCADIYYAYDSQRSDRTHSFLSKKAKDNGWDWKKINTVESDLAAKLEADGLTVKSKGRRPQFKETTDRYGAVVLRGTQADVKRGTTDLDSAAYTLGQYCAGGHISRRDCGTALRTLFGQNYAHGENVFLQGCKSPRHKVLDK